MTHPTTEGRGIPCQRCGGIFPLETLVAAVQCPYCGHRQALTSQTFVELRAYTDDVRAKLRQADQEYQQAATWKRWSETAGSGRQTVVILVLAIGVPMLVSLSMFGAHSLGLLPPAATPVITVTLTLGTYLLVFGYSIGSWLKASRSASGAKRASAGAAKVACPNCGAPSMLTVGESVDNCTHCGGALVPSRTAMVRGLDQARLALRNASLEKHRVERSTTAYYTQRDMSPYVPYIVAGSFLPMIGIGAIVFTIEMITGEEPFSPAIFLLWGFVFALVGFLVLFFLWRRKRAAEWRAAFDDLARQFSGTKIEGGLGGFVQWLNHYWAGKYSVHHLRTGAHYHAAALNVLGFPTAVEVLADSADRYRRPRVHLLLAAWVPGVSDGTGQRPAPSHDARWTADWLKRAGFDVDVTEAGLFARADDATVKRLRNRPEAFHAVSVVLTHLARYAAELGAEPVPP